MEPFFSHPLTTKVFFFLFSFNFPNKKRKYSKIHLNPSTFFFRAIVLFLCVDPFIYLFFFYRCTQTDLSEYNPFFSFLVLYNLKKRKKKKKLGNLSEKIQILLASKNDSSRVFADQRDIVSVSKSWIVVIQHIGRGTGFDEFSHSRNGFSRLHTQTHTQKKGFIFIFYNTFM